VLNVKSLALGMFGMLIARGRCETRILLKLMSCPRGARGSPSQQQRYPVNTANGAPRLLPYQTSVRRLAPIKVLKTTSRAIGSKFLPREFPSRGRWPQGGERRWREATQGNEAARYLAVCGEGDADFEGIAPALRFGQSARDTAQHPVRGQAVKCCDTFEPRVQGFAVVRRWTNRPGRKGGIHAAAERNRSWCLTSATGSMCSLPSRMAASGVRASSAVTLPVMPPLSSRSVRIIAASPKGRGLAQGQQAAVAGDEASKPADFCPARRAKITVGQRRAAQYLVAAQSRVQLLEHRGTDWN
jgi:hypothetical protein